MGDVISIVLGAVAGLITVILLAVRFWPKKKIDDPSHVFNCTGCKRKLRYRTSQVGHKGKCPQCGKALVFPPISAKATKR